MRARVSAVACGLAAALLLGCRSLPPLPEADLHQAGWVVREGQAVWRPKRDGAEIAGDLMVATGPGGDAFVQFTKNPFPMVTARVDGGQWQIESPLQNRRYTGRGQPPARIVWLLLPRALAGQTLPGGWSWQAIDRTQWRLTNSSTGETLEGFLNE
jgi:hypothetical protein